MLVNINVGLVVTTCGSCGVWFGLPEQLLAKRQQDGKSFFCPNGHSLSFTETELTRTQTRLTSTVLKLEHTEARLAREQKGRLRLERKVKRLVKT